MNRGLIADFSRTDADDLTGEELEQLAQSLAIDGSLGRADALRVVEVLRGLASARRAGGDMPGV